MTPAATEPITPPAVSAARLGGAGLAATAASIACTITVAAAGPSLLEPPLPGAPGGPPWALDLGLNPYLAVGLAVAGLAAGTLGVALTLRAMRRGWTVSPGYVLLAGALAAAVAGTTRPFGTSDFISYAAYGRELVTGHNPYLLAPRALARLGDPVARAVQDWAGTPSVYGALATGVFGLASVIGGTSARLTVFALGVVNVTAFIGTGVLLDRMARGRAARLRAAVLWTCNPLLLQILVFGSHVDGLAVALSIAGMAVLTPLLPNGPLITSPAGNQLLRASRPPGAALRGLLAGILLGLGFAVKPTVLLVALGLLIAIWGGAAALGLIAGFGGVAGADLLVIGRPGIAQTLRASGMVSVGSPWRVVRTVLSLLVAAPAADEVVRWCAVALAVFLAWRLLRLSRPPELDHADCAIDPLPPRSRQVDCAIDHTRVGRLRDWPASWAAFALVLAWLMAWPYVLPWYDALAWALLPLLPASGFDWVLLARTSVLAFGYLPARSAGITIPGGLRWMEPVLRTAVTPAVLALLLFIVVRSAARGWRMPTERDRYSADRDNYRDLRRRSSSRGDRHRDRADRAPAGRPRRARVQ